MTGRHLDERAARLLLAAAFEPDDPRLRRWLSICPAAELVQRLRSGDRSLAELRSRSGHLADLDADVLLHALAAVGARWVVPGDAEWPTQLDDLAEARPLGLWVRGDADLRLLALRSVAMVGARAASGYGVAVAADLAFGLAERGWAVVSGGAYGIDAAAHRGAMSGGGATVAVLAGGPDLLQPTGNAALLDRVAADGVLAGELPCGRRPSRTRLLARNRLIAALSRGTVVVEAAHRSGARRTATDAVRLNRQLMAVPGPVTSAVSAGCHALIREGAVLVTSATEVIEQVAPVAVVADLTSVAADGDPVLASVLAALPRTGGIGLAGLIDATGLATADVLAALDDLTVTGAANSGPAGWRLAARRGGP